MGLFKKVDETEAFHNEIMRLKGENTKLYGEIDSLRRKLEAAQNLVDTTPSDCTPGKWCAACEFSRCIHVPLHDEYSLGYEVMYVCGRGEVCKNFLQKEFTE